MGTQERNMELMQTLDDAWNAQDLDTFAQRHKTDVVVRWPGKPPTYGVDAHRAEAIDFFQTFPDQHLDNRPYKVFFASGDWTCSIARFTGTMRGPMQGPDGKEIPPTGKSFEVDFCTGARWDNGQIVEENLFSANMFCTHSSASPGCAGHSRFPDVTQNPEWSGPAPSSLVVCGGKLLECLDRWDEVISTTDDRGIPGQSITVAILSSRHPSEHAGQAMLITAVAR